MKKFLLLFVVFFIGVVAYTQKVYFIYLQSDNNAPFFVKMGDKIHSSTASGYVILPKLVDSTYALTIGFSGNETNESTFSVTINDNDKGFIIKNGDNGVSLFDWQAAILYKPVSSNNSNRSENEATAQTDNFTKLLSQAASDPSLLTIPAAVKNEKAAKPVNKQEAPQKEAVTSETVVEKKNEAKDTATTTPADTASTLAPVAAETTPVENPVAQETKNEAADTSTAIAATNATNVNSTTAPVAEEAAPKVENDLPFRRSVIMRKSESSTTEGFGLVYLDNTGMEVDTIRLLIPNPKIQFYTNADNETKPEEKAVVEDTKETTSQQPAAPATAIVKAPKISCGAIASEKDFFKLRRDMAEKATDDAMIDEAKKAFRRKCFTTEQIKNLSALFLTPAGKYQFFDAAYLHVSNRDQFKTLQSEIKDDYYSNRFKALIGNL